MLRTFFLLLLCLGCALQAETIKLQNRFFSLELDSIGGRIVSLRDEKSAAEFSAGLGLLNDSFWNIAESRSFLPGNLYSLENLQANELLLSAHHTGGGIDFMKLEKKVQLHQDSALISVEYTLHNLAGAMGALRYGFSLDNRLGPTQRRQCFYPTSNGIIKSDSTEALAELRMSQPVRNWMASIDEKGNGLVISSQIVLPRAFVQKTLNGKDAFSSLEMQMPQFSVAAAENLKLDFELLPFHGLKKVSGAGKGLVGSIQATPEVSAGGRMDRNIELSVFSASKQQVKIESYCRAVPDGAAILIDKRELSFAQAQSLQSFNFKHKLPSWPTLYDIDVRIFNLDGELLAVLNAPTTVHSSIFNYKLEPVQPKPEGEPIAEIDLTSFDNSLVTEHIAWAKPLAGGPIKVLALTPYPSYRELAELAQRLDIELHSQIWTLPYKCLFSTGDYYGTLTDDDVYNNLDRLLKQDYDLILIGGIGWKNFRPTQIEAIKQKLDSGTAFLEIGTSADDDILPDASALQVTGLGNGIPVKAESGYLSDLLPFSLMPHWLYAQGKAKGQVWATLQGYPWLCSYERKNKARSVNLAWYSGGGHGRMVQGLTPEIKYPNHGQVRNGFWEVMHLIMAKSLVYAAGREPQFRIGEVLCQAGQSALLLTVPFVGETMAEDLSLRVFARNKENQQLGLIETPLANGAKQIKLELKIPRFAGDYMIGLQLLNAKHEVIDFGAVAAKYEPEAKLLTLQSGKQTYQEGEMAEFTVRTENAQMADSLVWQWRDAYGRLLAKGSTQAKEQNQLSVKVGQLMLMRSYTLTVMLQKENILVDQLSCSIAVKPEAEKLQRRDYEPGIWLTPRSSDAIRPYLHPVLADKLREMRMQTLIANTPLLDVDFAINYNFHPTRLEHIGTRSARIPQAYVKSGNKLDLVREPCLSNPEFRQQMKKTFFELGQKYADSALRFYWLGDELSLVGYMSNPIDYCYSEFCQEHFRAWLLRKYGSLRGINQQWGSNYDKLELVLSDTLQEARKRQDGNYSSWADRLEYMDWLLLDFIKDVTDQGLHASDAKTEVFISGPQEPSAYGGNDWQRQPGIYDGMMSYSSGALREISLSFHPAKIDLPWSLGYGAYGSQVCYDLWQTLLVGSKGVMAFHAPSLINADYSFSRNGQAIVDYLPEIVDGLGKLLVFNLRRPAPQAYIVYSQPSIRAAHISGNAKNHTELRWKHLSLCKNFALAYRFISPEQIKAGLLSGKDSAKLLMLPDIVALDAETLQALEDYLDKGGVMMIEGGFADFDANCRKYPVGHLNSYPRLQKKAKEAKPCKSETFFQAWKKPLLLRNPEDQAALAEARQDMLQAITQAKLSPFARLVDGAGTLVTDLEQAFFEDSAGNKYLMVITHNDEAQKVHLQLSQPCWVYEAHNALEYASEQMPEWEISAGSPLLFAFVKQADEGNAKIEVKALPDNMWQIDINTKTSRDTVYNLQLISPDASEPFWYRYNIDAPAGKGSRLIQLALDDSPGVWSVKVRDVITGKQTEAKFSKEN
ncbi:MAG: beta-galactosidase [Lentisphaeria bacterium]|nr:beta-galactosidase [Lentisphaeria bacterium]